MNPRAADLLALPDNDLFAHGGRHVFACVLHDFSGLPLLWIHDAEATHDHVACDPGDGCLVDFFGHVAFSEYQKEEYLMIA